MTKAQQKSRFSPPASNTSLPHWDLADLYASPDAPELKRDLTKANKDAVAFQKEFVGKIATTDAATLGKAIKAYEKLEDVMGRLSSYAYLYYCTDVKDPERGKFMQGINEALTDASSQLVFFTLEINDVADAAYAALLTDKTILKYKPWLDAVRDWRPHVLSRELEEKLHERSVTGRSAWIRLYDEYLAQLRFPLDGKQLPVSDILNLMSNKDEAKRKAAAEVMGKVLGQNISTFTLITNTLAKDKSIEDGWRNYPSPMASRHLSNQVDQAVVSALTTAVQTSWPQLSHRYYALKAKWMGKKKLAYWNRNAPLPFDADRKFTWSQAVETVMTAYKAFSPELGVTAQKFFDNAWIDVPPAPNKVSGAFAHPTVPSAHPYLLLNFHGKVRDVATLAHELGHGVHQVLAAKQGALMADTPLTLAETASVFGEMLTFQSLLKTAKNNEVRKAMLAAKVEDMLNTVVRQIAFYLFEQKLHAARRQGELTPDDIGKLWLAVQTNSLGPALQFGPGYEHYWAYISHFIHTPFYVYAYAFGDCLVNALYGVYQEKTTDVQRADFAKKYLAMLSAGGTQRHKELLAPFGLDAAKPDFWQKGLNVISSMIDELEAL